MLQRLAVVGGAYGNLAGLEACLTDAAAAGVDARAFLGDAIGCCGHSEEVVALIRERFELLVAGNHEQQAVAGSDSCGCGYSSPDDEAISCEAFQLATATLGEASRAWLGTWPDARIIDTAGGRILLCHGSPGQTSEFLYEAELDDLRLEAWLDQFGVRGFVCTHSGLPWVRRLRGGRFAVNCGVAGKPDHDGDPAVHYALIDCPPQGEASLEIRRVSYDHERWAQRMEAVGIPPVFVEPVRTGVWTTGVASLPAAERHRPLRAAAAPAATPAWAPELLDPAAFRRVLGGAQELGLIRVAEIHEVMALFSPAFPYFAALRIADSLHVHIKVDDADQLPEAALCQLGSAPENRRPGYVKFSYAGGINLIFSSIDIAEEDRLPSAPARARPFVDHLGVDLRRPQGVVRATFDDVPALARRAGWAHAAQGGARPVYCCHAQVAEKHWAYPPPTAAVAPGASAAPAYTRPIEFAFGPLLITGEMMGCDLRPMDPRHPDAAAAACTTIPPH